MSVVFCLHLLALFFDWLVKFDSYNSQDLHSAGAIDYIYPMLAFWMSPSGHFQQISKNDEQAVFQILCNELLFFGNCYHPISLLDDKNVPCTQKYNKQNGYKCDYTFTGADN